MTTDKIIYFLLFTPFIWIIIFDQEKLKYRTVFLRYILISIVILIIGILYQKYSGTEDKILVYFGSQMTLIFLILFKIIRIPYYLIFKREPEISQNPENFIDIIPTLIVVIGTLILPFLIDSMIIQKITE
jgi:hypothetical protein